jgi:ribosomal protein S18 acetylase RimI-like enzyme
LSEGLKYHIDNNTPLTSHLYRAGSRAYFDLFAEARSLYSRGILEVKEGDDLAILTETDLGHFGVYEGQRVPLDFIMEEEEDTVTIKTYNVNGQKVVLATMGDIKLGALRLKPYKDSYQVDTVTVKPEYQGMGIGTEMYREANDNFTPLYSDENQTPAAKALWDKLIKSGEAKEEDGRFVMLPSNLDEAKKKKKKKNPPLNKPKRGGSKAYNFLLQEPTFGEVVLGEVLYMYQHLPLD